MVGAGSSGGEGAGRGGQSRAGHGGDGERPGGAEEERRGDGAAAADGRQHTFPTGQPQLHWEWIDRLSAGGRQSRALQL